MRRQYVAYTPVSCSYVFLYFLVKGLIFISIVLSFLLYFLRYAIISTLLMHILTLLWTPALLSR